MFIISNKYQQLNAPRFCIFPSRKEICNFFRSSSKKNIEHSKRFMVINRPCPNQNEKKIILRYLEF